MKHIKLVLVKNDDHAVVCEGCVFENNEYCSVSLDPDSPMSCTPFDDLGSTWIWKVEQE